MAGMTRKLFFLQHLLLLFNQTAQEEVESTYIQAFKRFSHDYDFWKCGGRR